MQVSPINNTNFNGKFLKTKTLDKLIDITDTNTLGRFDEVLKRASKVDDGLIFYIASFPKKDKHIGYGQIITDHLYLYKTNETDKSKMIEEGFSITYRKDGRKEDLLEKYSKILSKFIPTLEKIYPKTNFDEPREVIKASINNLLTNE